MKQKAKGERNTTEKDKLPGDLKGQKGHKEGSE